MSTQWPLLMAVAVLAFWAHPAQSELVAIETRVAIAPGVGDPDTGSWRFVSIDTETGIFTPISDFSFVPPFGAERGKIALLEGVVNGELLVQYQELSAYPDEDDAFKGYATFNRGNLNFPGSSVVFPNASGVPQILRTEGVPGKMFAIHETKSMLCNGLPITHECSIDPRYRNYEAHSLTLSAITESAKPSLKHLADLGTYGGIINNTGHPDPDDDGLYDSSGIRPDIPSDRTYRITGDDKDAYVMIRYDHQNEGEEAYYDYLEVLDFYLWKVPTVTNEAPIKKTFLNNNITIPCFRGFDFIFKKPNGDGKLLLSAKCCCRGGPIQPGQLNTCQGDTVGYDVLYEVDFDSFDAPTNASWVVRADSRDVVPDRSAQSGPDGKFGHGLSYTYDEAKEVLYSIGWYESQYLVWATDLSKQAVTSKFWTTIDDPEPQKEFPARYSLSGLAWLPDSEVAALRETTTLL